MVEKPVILRAAELPAATVAELHSLFTVLDLPKDPEAAANLLAAEGGRIRGMALRKTRVDRGFLDALPGLEVIASYSAGLENLDTAHAAARGIKVTNTSHILAQDVADTATAIALALVRDVVNADAFVRAGKWPGQPIYRLSRSIGRMKVGIYGFGAIGSAVAQRFAAMGAQIAYCGPREKPVPHRYFADLEEMASVCDLVILTAPLTPETRKAVSARVIRAIGPRGYLVNVSRGQVVDEAALISALAEGAIAGAALDVFETEPHVPPALIGDPRLVLTPHMGSGTEETRQAMADNVVDELALALGLQPPRR